MLALVAGGLVLFGGDDDEDSADQAAGEIFLEPAATVGPEPFSETSYESETIPTSSSSTTATTAVATTGSTAGATAVVALPGDRVGLYGGTGNQSRCDVQQMTAFLRANPSQAAAFVAALNADPTLRWSGGNQVTVDQLPQYLAELTPLTLTRDTRVTNHGFRNGRPTPRQSVLQAGTAVLVDRYGVPRSRCACGNPLIPPRQVTTTPTYTGDRWPGFNPVAVVVISQVNVEIDTFVVVDLRTGDLFERPAGTTGDQDTPTTGPDESTTTTTEPDLGTGDVQVTLRWSGDADVDLHVVDPSGTEIYYGNRESPTGGMLDYDKIPGTGEFGPHVENVFWPTGGAPNGAYEAWVEVFSVDSDPTVEFSLEVIVNGEVVATDGGSLGDGAESARIPFEF